MPSFTENWTTLGVKPSFVRNKHLRLAAERMVKEGGASTHSAMGATLKVMISYLEEAGVPYVLKGCPGQGYLLEVAAPNAR